MKLQILVPQYKETEEDVRPLLDSIGNQRNVSWGDIGVVIANDGTDVLLGEEFLKSYPFEIKYVTGRQHSGVSATRNACLDAASADYVMFCDADDCFFNALGLQIILGTIDSDPFDAMISAFVEELKDKERNRFLYPTREQDQIFVHGKVYRRSFLVSKNIRWGDELLVHEDSYFNCLALSSSQKTKYCPQSFYLWCWNDDSTSRRDPDYIVHTYHHLLKSADKLSHDLIERGLSQKAAEMFILNLYQTYFLLTGTPSEREDLREYIVSLSKGAKEFYEKYKGLLQVVPLATRYQISDNARNAARMQGWYRETLTFDQWILTLESIN